MIYALIKNGIVLNTIIADSVFVSAISIQWDFIIRIDQLDPSLGIGWAYNGSTFSPPGDE